LVADEEEVERVLELVLLVVQVGAVVITVEMEVLERQDKVMLVVVLCAPPTKVEEEEELVEKEVMLMIVVIMEEMAE
jgi:hypothetical protein